MNESSTQATLRPMTRRERSKQRRRMIPPAIPTQSVMVERTTEYKCTGCHWGISSPGGAEAIKFAILVHLEGHPYHVIVKTESRKTLIERAVTKEVRGA